MNSQVYPSAPGWKTESVETSRQAAFSVKAEARTVRANCLAALRGAAMTADEVADLLTLSVLTVRPRVAELKTQGLVEATVERRLNVSGKSAVVWKAVERREQQEMFA